MRNIWFLLLLQLWHSHATQEPTLNPTTTRVSNPCRINSCAQCTSQIECVWCGDSCIIEGEICYGNDPIKQESACTDYEPIAKSYFDQDYAYKYNAFINICHGTYNKTNNTNGTNETQSEYVHDIIYTIDYDKDCQNITYELMYWIDFADNSTSEYQLFGQVTNFQRVNQSHHNFTQINDTLGSLNESMLDPPCSIDVNQGVVNEIICPKDTIYNRSLLPIAQQDVLFTTLRYLLPRLEQTLFYQNNGTINEIDANGNVKMQRNAMINSTNDAGKNVTRLTTNYRQSDYNQYYGTKLKDKRVQYDTEIDPATNDVSRVTFQNTFILADMGRALIWNSFRYTLRSISKYKITEEVIEDLEFDIFVTSPKHGYTIKTYEFTMDEWRGVDPGQEKKQTIPFSNTTEDNIKKGYQKRYEQEIATGRRRLQLKLIADVILAMFDNKEHWIVIFGFEVHWLQVIQGIVKFFDNLFKGDFEKLIDPAEYEGIPEKLEVFSGVYIDIYHKIGLAIGTNWQAIDLIGRLGKAFGPASKEASQMEKNEQNLAEKGQEWGKDRVKNIGSSKARSKIEKGIFAGVPSYTGCFIEEKILMKLATVSRADQKRINKCCDKRNKPYSACIPNILNGSPFEEWFGSHGVFTNDVVNSTFVGDKVIDVGKKWDQTTRLQAMNEMYECINLDVVERKYVLEETDKYWNAFKHYVTPATYDFVQLIEEEVAIIEDLIAKNYTGAIEREIKLGWWFAQMGRYVATKVLDGRCMPMEYQFGPDPEVKFPFPLDFDFDIVVKINDVTAWDSNWVIEAYQAATNPDSYLGALPILGDFLGHGIPKIAPFTFTMTLG
eukprot:476729_1